jgi:sugar lactone lactonase YvrE
MLASDVPLAMGPDGNLYYPSRAGGGLDILRLMPSGKNSVLASLELPHLNGLTAGPDGALYYTENDAVRRISAQGQVSTIAKDITLTGCASIPGMEAHDPQLRGLAVDASGTVYVAASGCGRVLKITPNGQITSLIQIQSPWSPTAVALFGNDIYVLEYLHTAVEDRLQWLPRVRRISADGKNQIIATVVR